MWNALIYPGSSLWHIKIYTINSNATTINKNNHSKKSTIRLKSSRKIFKDSRKKKKETKNRQDKLKLYGKMVWVFTSKNIYNNTEFKDQTNKRRDYLIIQFSRTSHILLRRNNTQFKGKRMERRYLVVIHWKKY